MIRSWKGAWYSFEKTVKLRDTQQQIPMVALFFRIQLVQMLAIHFLEKHATEEMFFRCVFSIRPCNGELSLYKLDEYHKFGEIRDQHILACTRSAIWIFDEIEDRDVLKTLISVSCTHRLFDTAGARTELVSFVRVRIRNFSYEVNMGIGYQWRWPHGRQSDLCISSSLVIR